MFLPLFMAIFLGLVSPSDANYSNYNSDDIIYVTVDNNGDNPDAGSTDENPDTDTGGEVGSIPPR